VRIALDATYSVGSQLTGIGIYSLRLIHGLATEYPEDEFLFCYRPKQFRRARIPQTNNVCRRLLQPPLPIFGADLFHGLNQRVDRRPARRVVSTFHDLFVMTGEYSSPEFRARFTKQAKSAAAKSDLIITVSSFTADQVCSLLNVEKSRIRVIPHGVDLPSRSDESLREDLILFVGALQTRKNIHRLVEAFERLHGQWRLVLAGAPSGYGGAEIVERIERSPARSRIQLTGYLAPQQLDDLYRRARIFAFATLDEGFGIPVLEAMAHGIPVITSNRSALPEVAGTAALLVDPYSVDELQKALSKLVSSSALRAEMAQRGHTRAAQFPWTTTVSSTYQIYREILK
jgi:glycosyltransferase involved in cell wall biosynthesis